MNRAGRLRWASKPRSTAEVHLAQNSFDWFTSYTHEKPSLLRRPSAAASTKGDRAVSTVSPRARRGPGRPRNGGAQGEGSSRDQIIRTANALFAQRGFANTTVTEIATAAGLTQSSFYYYFKSKEEILHSTLALNRQALEVAAQLEADEKSAATKLFTLLRYDTLQLCLSPFDFNDIERTAQVQIDDFADFWLDYRALYDHVERHIREGVADRSFIPCDPSMTAYAALSLNEGLQKRFHQQLLHAQRSEEFLPREIASAEEFALVSASTTLASLLRDRRQLDKLRRPFLDGREDAPGSPNIAV